MVTIPSYTPQSSGTTLSLDESQQDIDGITAVPSGYTPLSYTESEVNTTQNLSFSTTSNGGMVTITASESSECFINSSHTYYYNIAANVDGLEDTITSMGTAKYTNPGIITFGFTPPMNEQPAGTKLQITVYYK